MTGLAWAVERRTGPAGVHHRRPLPDPVGRSAWVHQIDRPALVLGSAQGDDVVDRPAAERAGVEVVRRRSGGGAVLLVPGEVAWVDVLVPTGDPLWEPDVGRAFHWLGAVWVAALRSVGVAGPVAHTRPLVGSRWSRLVCFAGLGPGEVTVGGAKLVGVSQRRTRAGVRFQCALHRAWRPERLAPLLALSAEDRAAVVADLAGAVVTVGDPDEVVDAVVATLPG